VPAELPVQEDHLPSAAAGIHLLADLREGLQFLRERHASHVVSLLPCPLGAESGPPPGTDEETVRSALLRLAAEVL
jgi:hypothetical protein